MTKTLDEKFAELKAMVESGYPSVTGRKEAYKSLTPDIAHDEEIRQIINKEIDDADIDMEDDKDIMESVNSEIEKEKEFEMSMEGMSDEEKEMKRAERKMNME